MAQKTANGAAATATNGFTDDERAAMRERVKEIKAAKRRSSRASKTDGEGDLLAKIAEMAEPDRVIAERLHALITSSVPALSPRTWYGMPAYAKDDKVVCYFKAAQKFKERYATFGFNDKANLDDGAMWPVVYALTELTPAAEERIAALVKQAAS